LQFIEIKKEKIPYEFTLDNRFYFEVRHNNFNNVLYFVLYDRKYSDENDGKGRIMGEGDEKAILNFPLFWPFQRDSNPNYPGYKLTPVSLDGKNYRVTYDNISEKVVMKYELV